MSEKHRRILGAVLAGGRSSRFGSDKSEALWRGQSLLDHSVAALACHCEQVVVGGEARSHSRPGLGFLADRPEPDLGPLGGLCAALEYARNNGFDAVLSAPVDAHPVPDNLIGLLDNALPSVLAGQWLFGLWPSALAGQLETHVRSGKRSVLSWVEACGARQVDFHGQPPVNINTPAMLEALE